MILRQKIEKIVLHVHLIRFHRINLFPKLEVKLAHIRISVRGAFQIILEQDVCHILLKHCDAESDSWFH